MNVRTVRQTFLDFFAEKGHHIVPSAPLINRDDPTLLFINAGMNPFKDIFTGHKPVQFPRIADTQKCLRVSGKHNDLEDVGHDTYHHTFFEMLGNWSFGDYFKREAIEWAWELLVERYGISPDRLYATVFEGDATEGVPADDAAASIWAQFLPADRILKASKKDNFWEMGDTGPCGPCSEVHVDLRPGAERAILPGRELVNQDHPQVIEIWNLVFIQFNRKADGSLEPLQMQSVDTGMGLERLCMVLQGKLATYDIDVFQQLRTHLQQVHGADYHASDAHAVAIRVAVDHIRAIAFAMADGQLPGNTGAGYVIRRLIRRAVRYAYQYLGIQEPFLYRMIPLLAQEYGDTFPEVAAQADFVARVLEQEEKNFLSKLSTGTAKFEQYLADNATKANRVIDGKFAFELYDTFGFPLDLTQLMAREQGWQVDAVEFDRQMEIQRNRSRAASEVKAGDWVELLAGVQCEFLGYDTLKLHTEIVKYRTVETPKGKEYQLVLARTPFYAESGGQVGDTGILRAGDEVVRVLDTQRQNELIVHRVDRLPRQLAGEWLAQVDADRRAAVVSNHSATHLLHAALRRVLGTHVEQRGSLVGPDVLRFDFSHFEKVSDAQLREIEALVNAQIAAGITREEFRSVPIEEAKAMGAMALFGEKYGDAVRVIRFGADYSTELCGGCHVPNTLHIRLFKIISESSIAAGIRRIEAVTGAQALRLLTNAHEQLQAVRALLKQPKDLLPALESILQQQRELERKLEKLQMAELLRTRDRLLDTLQPGRSWIAELVEVDSAEALKTLSFELKKNGPPSAAYLLAANIDGKPLLSLMLTDDLAAQDSWNAPKLIKELAKPIQGGGGGQPFYATAGGKRAEGLQEAVQLAISKFAALGL